MSARKKDDNTSLRPPGDEALLEQFKELAEDYLFLTSPWRLGDSGREGVEMDDGLNRGRMFRCSLIRKFTFSGENVYIPEVLNAYLRVAKTQRRVMKEERVLVDRIGQDFRTAIDLPFAMRLEGRVALTAADVLHKITYGRLLHSDYEKWAETRSYPASLLMPTLVHTLALLETCLVETSELITVRPPESAGKTPTDFQTA